MAQNIKTAIKRDLEILDAVDRNRLVEKRYDKLRKIGIFEEEKSE